MAPNPSELAERARAAGRVGIDTEFMGEGRYQPLLCLVQIALDDGDGDEVESSSIRSTEEYDPEPLAECWPTPTIEVVLHAGRQDVALLRRDWGTPVRNVFDTQVAAGFAGMRAQLGYEPLLKEMLGVRLRKSASFTRWDDRPLTPSSSATRARTSRTCSSSRARCRTGSRARAAWSGRARSAAPSRPSTTCATSTRSSSRLPRVNSLEPRAARRRARAGRVARGGPRATATARSRSCTTGADRVAKRRPAEHGAPAPDPRGQEATLHRRGRRAGPSTAAASARGSPRGRARRSQPAPRTRR